MKTWILGAVIVAALGCGKETKVHVTCAGTGADHILCTTVHTEGTKRVEPCWDYVIGCKNGVQARAHACTKVDPGGTVTTLIPTSEFHNLEDCDALASTAVDHMTVSVAP